MTLRDRLFWEEQARQLGKGHKMLSKTVDHIAIEAFKRDKYDRGSKVILVNGEKWGEIAMVMHGCHGPTYHVSDLHGPVTIGVRKVGRHAGEGREHSFQPKSAKSVRFDNIGKPDDQRVKPVPTDEQLRIEVAGLIASGHLRSPEVRNKEIGSANDQLRQRIAKANEIEAAEFRRRAIHALLCDGEWCSTPDDVQVECVIRAMRWAQTQ